MANKPIVTPLPADLPENWNLNQYISPLGTDVGLSARHGYNYQSKQINDAQKGINTLNDAFPSLATDADFKTHTNNSVVHVTQGDKDAWNDQSRAFRYIGAASGTSSALTVSSTRAIKNGDSIKIWFSGTIANNATLKFGDMPSYPIVFADEKDYTSYALSGAVNAPVILTYGESRLRWYLSFPKPSEVLVTPTDRDNWNLNSKVHVSVYANTPKMENYNSTINALYSTTSTAFALAPGSNFSIANPWGTVNRKIQIIVNAQLGGNDTGSFHNDIGCYLYFLPSLTWDANSEMTRMWVRAEVASGAHISAGTLSWEATSAGNYPVSLWYKMGPNNYQGWLYSWNMTIVQTRD